MHFLNKPFKFSRNGKEGRWDRIKQRELALDKSWSFFSVRRGESLDEHRQKSVMYLVLTWFGSLTILSRHKIFKASTYSFSMYGMEGYDVSCMKHNYLLFRQTRQIISSWDFFCFLVSKVSFKNVAKYWHLCNKVVYQPAFFVYLTYLWFLTWSL